MTFKRHFCRPLSRSLFSSPEGPKGAHERATSSRRAFPRSPYISHLFLYSYRLLFFQRNASTLSSRQTVRAALLADPCTPSAFPPPYCQRILSARRHGIPSSRDRRKGQGHRKPDSRPWRRISRERLGCPYSRPHNIHL